LPRAKLETKRSSRNSELCWHAKSWRSLDKIRLTFARFKLE
jgi:hypothetical protein